MHIKGVLKSYAKKHSPDKELKKKCLNESHFILKITPLRQILQDRTKNYKPAKQLYLKTLTVLLLILNLFSCVPPFVNSEANHTYMISSAPSLR